ncbi:MAG: hypothetical protein KDC09_13180 [Bacteroidales bacterium]|nr:hypothetical protein [Bacteroidales bacterium]
MNEFEKTYCETDLKQDMINNTKEYYKILAEMFSYPEHHLTNRYEEFEDAMAFLLPEKKTEIKDLFLNHKALSFKDQQEYYLKTFDVQAVCHLDIGYVLFGDDYKRAQLLVNLQAEHQKAGIDCGTELADHLPNILKLLVTTEDQDFANELGFVVLIPAIQFMILKFSNTENHYKGLLEILLELLKRDFKGEDLEEYVIPEQYFKGEQDFLIPSPKQTICDTLCNQRKKI